MPVLVKSPFTKEHTNPRLKEGGVYRILSANDNYQCSHIFAYHDANDSVVYLTGGSWDSKDVLDKYNMRFVEVTLQEV